MWLGALEWKSHNQDHWSGQVCKSFIRAFQAWKYLYICAPAQHVRVPQNARLKDARVLSLEISVSSCEFLLILSSAENFGLHFFCISPGRPDLLCEITRRSTNKAKTSVKVEQVTQSENGQLWGGNKSQVQMNELTYKHSVMEGRVANIESIMHENKKGNHANIE